MKLPGFMVIVARFILTFSLRMPQIIQYSEGKSKIKNRLVYLSTQPPRPHFKRYMKKIEELE
jgi:hypothetical protein